MTKADELMQLIEETESMRTKNDSPDVEDNEDEKIVCDNRDEEATRILELIDEISELDQNDLESFNSGLVKLYAKYGDELVDRAVSEMNLSPKSKSDPELQDQENTEEGEE